MPTRSPLVALPVSAQQPSAEAGAIVEKAPGMSEVGQVSIVANVVALNARTQTVTLRVAESTLDLRKPLSGSELRSQSRSNP